MTGKYSDTRNLTMLADFYEFVMANGLLAQDRGKTVTYFDMFFRGLPDGGGFAITAGLEQLIESLQNLRFNKTDIEYLRNKGFHPDFIEYLTDFEFCCDIWAVPEGTPVFPGEPLVTVRGPAVQAQFIESIILLCINHQTLIATKANRIVRAAQGREVYEFGTRRAHGADAALFGARAAYIGGCTGTSCTPAELRFGIPAAATMTHSWVQMFDNEKEAFIAFAEEYPDNCSLLVDTYDTLKSGIPNALEVFRDYVAAKGFRPKAIRIDSGDLAYLSRKARRMLDEAGFSDCEIVASNSLDEYIIRDMVSQGAKVDTFLVGERLITSASSPVFGGVYKLSAVETEGKIKPCIKLSENVTKITIPCFKKLWRLFDRDSGKAIADLLTLADEEIDENEAYELFDPDYTWKRKTVTNFIARPLQKKIFDKGKPVYDSPDVHQIREYCAEQIDSLWEEVLRFENPHNYYVDLSQKLWDEKKSLIDSITGR